MLLVFTQKITPRLTYSFKHICKNILGIDIEFTSQIETFVAHNDLKLSYGKQALGSEYFIKSDDLLFQQGLADIPIFVQDWDDTKCFFSTGDKSALPYDIFAASFYLLSRYEEYLPHVKDDMGRFPVSKSLAYQNDFLDQAVIDIWAYKFLYSLRLKFPEIKQEKRKFKFHNIVIVPQVFAYRKKGILRNAIGFLNDFRKFELRRLLERIKVLLKFSADPYNTFEWLIEFKKKSVTKLSVLFLVGDVSRLDRSINPNKKVFKSLIKYVADYAEVGILFSTLAMQNSSLLKTEKKRLEQITHRPLKSSMNSHYLLNLPDDYRNAIDLEISCDFNMGYHNTPGFRAGTCRPFLFYDLIFERQIPLRIYPFVITKKSLLSLGNASQIKAKLNMLIDQVCLVNGTFISVFKNNELKQNKQDQLWRTIYTNFLQADE